MAGKADLVNSIVDSVEITPSRKFPYYDGWGDALADDDAAASAALAPAGTLTLDPLGGG